MDKQQQKQIQDCIKFLRYHGLEAYAPHPKDDFVVFIELNSIILSIRECEIVYHAENWNETYIDNSLS